MIVTMAGLPGTGKSTLARALAGRLNAVVLNKDTLRAAMFPPEEIEYSHQQDDFVVSVMFDVAGYYFRKDPARVVFLDGRTFSKKAQIDTLVATCAERGWKLKVIECVCPDDVARARLERDVLSGLHPAADRDFSLYLRLKAQADPITIPHLTIDTGEPLEDCVQRSLSYLLETP
jgi:adenylylsulfate kinase